MEKRVGDRGGARGVSETIPVWLAALSTIIGSGVGTTIVSWLLQRVDRSDRLLTKDDLDKALSDSQVIREIQSKLGNDYASLHRIELNSLRAELFAHTTSRTQHERQLEAGAEYLKLGGNGLGHARLDWLTHDYEQRLADCDWDYTRSHHND